MNTTIDAAIINDNKILLVKKRDVWILPGGKLGFDESDLGCLCREVKEELSGTKLDNIRYYGEFEGIAPHKGYDVTVRVYFADINGELQKPSAEISDAAWVDDTTNYTLSDTTSRIIDALRRDGYL